MALLMTPTLWDSIKWLHDSPDSWKKRAYNNLLDQLNRVWNPTDAIKRGIAWEDKICNKKNPIAEISLDLHKKFTTAYDLIHYKGGQFQAKAKKIVEYDDKEFILYGKMDVFLPTHIDYIDGLIVDIKTTGNYKGKSSYLSKWQHKLYCWLKRIHDFKYIIYEFGEHGNIIDIHIIDYHVDDFGPVGTEIMENLSKVVTFLRTDKKLSSAYMKKFNLYN